MTAKRAILWQSDKVKVGVGLRLREAWKAHLESRSTVQPYVRNIKPAIADDDENSEVASFSKEAIVGSPPSLELQSIGYRDECITVDARRDKKGEWVLVKGSDQFDPKVDPAKAVKVTSILDPYCMVITRRLSRFGDVESTNLEIQSTGLIKLIRSIVTYYSDDSFRVGDKIKFDDPPRLLFHYRKELTEYKNRKSIDERLRLHITYALNFLHSHLGAEIERYEELLAAGMVNFTQLWMLFRPGELIYKRSTEQLYYLQRVEIGEYCGQVAFLLTCSMVDFDGEKLGKVQHVLKISCFNNTRTLSSLSVIPLDHCDRPEAIRKMSIARAKRFMELRGVHALQHRNLGRVMVDAQSYIVGHKTVLEDKPIILEKCKCICSVCKKEVDERPQDYDHDVRQISNEEMLICSSAVLGFALSHHEWIKMQIDDLSDIEWTEDALDRLVMDDQQKKVLSGLVSSRVFTQGYQGDIIGWKGRGLVVLLHGQPGTGKTLTAESMCESLKRPLYIVSGGELGASPEQVDQNLQLILKLSKRWNAIILIDEADVFLEERSSRDIVRNNYVSVFLRRLEYFEGILILTTNRVERFDEAFISRIHLAMHYTELEPWMRKEIWKNALGRLDADQVEIDITQDLEEISNIALNGRVISYAVRTAKAIAEEEKSKLTLEHLRQVVGVHQKFHDHLRSKRSNV